MNVTPELLIASGAQADVHSQDIFASHSRADTAVDSALFGWVGRSAAALSTRAATWADATTALSTRVYEHGEALRLAGLNFAELERDNADAATQVHTPGASP